MTLTVIGIGQSLRGDDGAGPEAVRRWMQDFSPTASIPRPVIVFLETPGLALLDYLEGSDSAVLVDAVSTGRQPGTVQVFSSLPPPQSTAAEKSAHGFGLAETLAVARTTGTPLPEPLILIGIEGGQYELGKGLSDPVREALPRVAGTIQRVVSELANREKSTS